MRIKNDTTLARYGMTVYIVCQDLFCPNRSLRIRHRAAQSANVFPPENIYDIARFPDEPRANF